MMSDRSLRFVIGSAVCMLLFACSSALAGTYYVSPEGDDANPGTEAEPWQSLEHVSAAASAGDTIVFLPGDYRGQLAPVNSGTAEAPIVFTAAERRTARLIGGGGESRGWRSESDREDAVVLTDVSHIHVRGLHLEPDLSIRTRNISKASWMVVYEASHIVIEDCRFRGGHGWSPFRVEASEQVKLLDNDFAQDKEGFDMIRIHHSRHVLVEGNAFSRSQHTVFALRQDRGNQFVVIRGNVFHSGRSRNFEAFSDLDVLIENNIFTNAFDGERAAMSISKFIGDRIIFRNNVNARNHGSIWHSQPMGTNRGHTIRNARLYNNVFADNREDVFAIHSSSDVVEDIVFANNIFAFNDPYGSETHFVYTGGDASDLRLTHNLFWGEQQGADATAPIIRLNTDWARARWQLGGPQTLAEVESDSFHREFGPMFTGNMHADPGFTDRANFDYTLRSDSAAIDRGTFLSKASADGAGREMPVTDTYPFYDGYGIEGEQGDLIAIGSSSQLARIVKVDHDAGVLQLDRDVQWTKGMAVGLPWSGEAPDLGAYEQGNARPAARVTVSQLEVDPGDEVTFQAHVYGLEAPLTYQWLLGDGTRAEGESVTHRYQEAYDYGVRVRVTDANGKQVVGVGYVDVVKARPEGVLIHSTFEDDDEHWYYLWQRYSDQYGGGGARSEHLVDEETGEAILRIYAPADGQRMPLLVHPNDWNIDEYPYIRIRYRIQPNTPIAAIVRPYQNAEVGRTHVTLAGTTTHPRGDQQMVDDGEWHTIELDVRKVREQYPDTQYLATFRIGTMNTIDDGEPGKEGDQYWISEIYIGQ